MSSDLSFMSSYWSFESWMNLIIGRFLTSQDQVLFLKGLQKHPEWLNRTNGGQETALMIAARNDFKDLIVELIKLGADVNAQDEEGWTALITASRFGSMESVLVLLNCDALKLNLQTITQETALMKASRAGFLDVVRELIKAGADLNLQNEEGRTALICAIDNGRETVARALVEAGADLNTKTENGWTALMIAAEKGGVETVRWLLEAGADLHQETTSKRTVLDIAKKGDNKEIVECLEAFSSQKILEQVVQSPGKVVTMKEETVCEHGSASVSNILRL